MEPPKDLRQNSLVKWIIGVLTAVVILLWGAYTKAQYDLLSEARKGKEDAEKKNDRLQDELSKCQEQKNLYEVIHRFGVAPGKKTVEVTLEQNNSYEE